MILACQVCGEPFSAKRSDAKTCSDACRAKRSRRARDPLIGSAERRQRQLKGLDEKYTYRQRGQARSGLQLLGLLPSNPIELSEGGEKDGEKFRFDRTPYALSEKQGDLTPRRTRYRPYRPTYPGAYVRVRTGLFAAISFGLEDDPTKRLWSPGDSFDNHEVYLGFRDSASPSPGWNSGPYWPKCDGPGDYADYDEEERPEEIPWGYNGNVYGELRDRQEVWGDVVIPESPVWIVDRGKWWNRLSKKLPKPPEQFMCVRCGDVVSVKSVLAHKCSVRNFLGFDLSTSVTRHTKGGREVVPLFAGQSQNQKEKGDECAA